jgi:predicted Zn-dependent protease
MKLGQWLISFLTVFLLGYFLTTSSSQISQISQIEPDHISVIHKTIFVDRNFDQDEIIYIIASAMEWNNCTHHFVDFEVVMLPSEQIINSTRNDILIIKVNPDYPDIISVDLDNQYTTLGLYNKDYGIPTIEIVSERIDDYQLYYQAVILHELGHALGLSHNKDIDGINTIMYPNINLSSEHLTKTDLSNFCKIYKCQL